MKEWKKISKDSQIIGIDLDNTLINYEKALLAMIQNDFPEFATLETTKNGVKAAIVAKYGSARWTVAQGKLYSTYLVHAEPYDGAIPKLLEIIELGHCVNVISHKTKYPISGGTTNLRKLALKWLKDNGLLDSKGGVIESGNVYFEDTISKKVARINELNCKVFIDDLYEIIHKIDSNVKKIWIFGNKTNSVDKKISVPATWSEINPSEWDI